MRSLSARGVNHSYFAGGRNYVYMSVTKDLKETSIFERYLLPLLRHAKLGNFDGKSVQSKDIYDPIDNMFALLFDLTAHIRKLTYYLSSQITDNSLSENPKFDADVIVKIDNLLKQVFERREELLKQAIDEIKNLKGISDLIEIKGRLNSFFKEETIIEFENLVRDKREKIEELVQQVLT
ncbi:hypothetical protein BHY_1165 (plasmid) [Borrelia nietonii YOR]|uniref:Uncharacterized protein n=3 Tax=Borrelia TaxID=138 RepID=W5SG49_9SPIR|nr:MULTISPECIES: hypothetical protein [Borrelia]AHH04116.1 hypothetical protein BHY_1165 [Borrelia nietonii YOR]AHH14695.1 hypothetical protein BHW_0122300 [Borrelia hermsii MTW]